MLAHGTGIDDLVLIVAAVGTFLIVSTVSRRRRTAEAAPTTSECPYCDRALEPGAVRCAGCGFRAPRASAGPG